MQRKSFTLVCSVRIFSFLGYVFFLHAFLVHISMIDIGTYYLTCVGGYLPARDGSTESKHASKRIL